jgi:hypothetical protein
MGKATENLARVTPIGLDLAKTVFSSRRRRARRARHHSQASARDEFEVFGRLAPCVVAMGASAPHWGRQLVALGHEVKLIPPACKVICTAQQDGCGRRRGYLPGGGPCPPAVRRFAFGRQPGGGDASSGSRAIEPVCIEPSRTPGTLPHWRCLPTRHTDLMP